MTDHDAGAVDESPADRLPPRGCNPLVFGVVAGTLQMAVILWLLYGR